MPFPKSRIPFTVTNPYRSVRPAASKIIFLSLEGSVTEEEYFFFFLEIYSEIRTRIQFISVAEDAVHTIAGHRTPEQAKMLSKARPKQLVERIDRFKAEKEDIYQFSEYPDDEFWIVVDVDKNWSQEVIDPAGNKTYRDEWDEAIEACREKGYGYAVSNPFFEVWLLLHHDVPRAEDRTFAVTDEHEYEKTAHFRQRLRELHAPLKKDKHIEPENYDEEKIRLAVHRAEELHIDKNDFCPKYLASTVYMLLRKMMDMLPEQEKTDE